VIVASAQLSFPKGFKRVKGENLTGVDDVYSNGRYSFQTHRVSVAYDQYTGNDEAFSRYVSTDFGFPFHRTKDGLLWGTGKSGGFYSYIVVDWSGDAFELFSKYDDEGFSFYSRWLLSTIRGMHREGKMIIFPMEG
jgi:hypothetical protein